MKLKRLFVATSLVLAASASTADAVVRSLDLSSGKTMFGREDVDGNFIDIYSFTLASSAFLTRTTVSGAARSSQDLNFSNVQIINESSNVLATFICNLGDDQNEFYSLRSTLLAAGNYQLLIRGVNSPTQASYSGILALSAAPNVMPEPGGLALMLAGLGAAVVLQRLKPTGSKA